MNVFNVTHMIEFSKEDVLEVSNEYINVDMKRNVKQILKGLDVL